MDGPEFECTMSVDQILDQYETIESCWTKRMEEPAFYEMAKGWKLGYDLEERHKYYYKEECETKRRQDEEYLRPQVEQVCKDEEAEYKRLKKEEKQAQAAVQQREHLREVAATRKKEDEDHQAKIDQVLRENEGKDAWKGLTHAQRDARRPQNHTCWGERTNDASHWKCPPTKYMTGISCAYSSDATDDLWCAIGCSCASMEGTPEWCEDWADFGCAEKIPPREKDSRVNDFPDFEKSDDLNRVNGMNRPVTGIISEKRWGREKFGVYFNQHFYNSYYMGDMSHAEGFKMRAQESSDPWNMSLSELAKSAVCPVNTYVCQVSLTNENNIKDEMVRLGCCPLNEWAIPD